MQLTRDQKQRTVNTLKEQCKGTVKLIEVVKSNAYKTGIMEQVINRVKMQKERDILVSERI